jgi:hypothetical protein
MVSPSLPANAWSPTEGASIVVYWQPASEDGFDVVLQLIDPALLDDGDPGFIVWDRVGADQPQLPFSLRTETGGALVLSGRFEYRLPKDPPPPVDAPPPAGDAPRTPAAAELWLVHAEYPGGSTAAARIA